MDDLPDKGLIRFCNIKFFRGEICYVEKFFFRTGNCCRNYQTGYILAGTAVFFNLNHCCSGTIFSDCYLGCDVRLGACFRRNLPASADESAPVVSALLCAGQSASGGMFQSRMSGSDGSGQPSGTDGQAGSRFEIRRTFPFSGGEEFQRRRRFCRRSQSAERIFSISGPGIAPSAVPE